VKARRSHTPLVPENISTASESVAPASNAPKLHFIPVAETKPENGKEAENHKEAIKSTQEKENDKVEKKEGSTMPQFNFGTFSWPVSTGGKDDKPFWTPPTSTSSLTPTFTFPSTFSSTNTSILGLDIKPPKSPPAAASDDDESGPQVDGSPEKEEVTAPPVLSENVKTGEEDEIHSYQTRAKLFVLEGDKWKERGVGIFRVNSSKEDPSSARLIMRTEGSLRLILNVAIWSQIRPEKAGDKAVRFVATALEGSSLCSYLIRVAQPSAAIEIIEVIEKYKKLAAAKSSGTPKKEGSKAEVSDS